MKKINGRMRVGKGVIKGVGGWRVGKWVIKEVGGHGERDYTGDAKGRVGKGMIKGCEGEGGERDDKGEGEVGQVDS